MYELIQVTESAYYIQCPAKIGLVRTGPDRAVLIDSGSDKDAGKKAKKILDANGWKLEAIYNTHSHADHIGGNEYLQKQTGCRVYAFGIERDFTEHPVPLRGQSAGRAAAQVPDGAAQRGADPLLGLPSPERGS